MLRAPLQNILFKSLWATQTTHSRFGMLTDKLTERQDKKAKQQFKQEIQHMANKPSWTYMDYKLRVADELTKLTKGLKSKFSNEGVERQKSLNEQKSILNAMFEEQLVEETDLKKRQKKEISLVTQIPNEKINQVIRNVKRYKNMHLMLRRMKQRGEDLPEDMESLQYAYMHSGIQLSDQSNRYAKYQKRSRAQRNRLIKFNRM